MQNSTDRRRQAAEQRRLESVRRDRVLQRDAGLQMIGRTTRWLAVGAAGATGAVALYASHAFHSHHHALSAAAPAASTAAPAASTSTTGTSTNPAGLQAGSGAVPVVPVQQVPVVSGGS